MGASMAIAVAEEISEDCPTPIDNNNNNTATRKKVFLLPILYVICCNMSFYIFQYYTETIRDIKYIMVCKLKFKNFKRKIL